MPSRVLIVEDNAIIRKILMRQLNRFGVNSYAVANAEEAIDLAEFFDLILMDVQLPGMSGIDAAKRIREIENDKDLDPVPIVAITASQTEEECRSAGMDEHCLKPLRLGDLERLLSRWVYGRPQKLRLLG